MTPPASVVITTKNRRDDLRGALASAFSQTIQVEVVVVDDGSTDGTADMVRTEFPSARLFRNEVSTGYIVARNAAARWATAPILVSIDDDAVFSSPLTVAQTLCNLDHPRVGAVAIPFVNVNQDRTIRQHAKDAYGVWISDRYTGTAHAIRRDLFLRLGGYREHFVHQGEEGDFCLRMLAAGYVVRLGTADPIHHSESPRRCFERMDYFGRRNEYLYAWHNIPLPEVVPHAVVSTLKCLVFMCQLKRSLRHQLSGMLSGLVQPMRHWKGRHPVSRSVYWLSRRLRMPVLLDSIESELPVMR